MSTDLLLTHGYVLADDPREREIMRPFPPLGLQYLVAWLRRHGTSVEWFDTTFSSPAGLDSAIEAANPRVLGLYGHTITRPHVLAVARAARDAGRRVIAGGPDPVQYLDEYLDGGVEVVVIGEGERTLSALVEHLGTNRWRWDPAALARIDGIAFRDPTSGTIVRTRPRELLRPLSSLPWPHREPADHASYFRAWRERHGETAMSLTTSRGCPYHCTWCSKQVYGDTFRRREVTDVVDEVLSLREQYDPDQLWFVDDVFTINRKWVYRFCEEMVTRRAVLPFYLIARPESVDRPLLDALAAAGCWRIYFSAESGAQHVLDAMKKENAVEDVFRAARLVREVGIEIGAFVMLGYPGEDKDDVRATLRMLHEIAPEVTLLSVAHPMKGTAFFDDVRDRVIASDAVWDAKNGGRLRFRMRYPDRFYEVAQKYFWTDLGLRRKLARGEWDRELAKLAVKYPVWRAAFEWYGRAPTSP